MTDCVAVWAGPAGLAVSAALAGRGVEHLVLERGRAGETWRSQRWDSFRLNTPVVLRRAALARPARIWLPFGLPGDAAAVADAVEAHLGSEPA